jgi:hypothetical protein
MSDGTEIHQHSSIGTEEFFGRWQFRAEVSRDPLGSAIGRPCEPTVEGQASGV